MLDFFKAFDGKNYCASAFGFIFLRISQNSAKILSKNHIDKKQLCIKVIDSLMSEKTLV